MPVVEHTTAKGIRNGREEFCMRKMGGRSSVCAEHPLSRDSVPASTVFPFMERRYF
jgi:hypothetical protein